MLRLFDLSLRVNTHRAVRLARRLAAQARRGDTQARADPPPLQWDLVGTLAEYDQLIARAAPAIGAVESELVAAHPDGPFTVPGFCWVDAMPVAFEMDYQYADEGEGRRSPNWRERMVCPTCRLNNRQRSALHLATVVLGLGPSSRIYITEQVTATYGVLKSRFPDVAGSEFLGADVGPGHVNERGIRHEDLTRLSFADHSRDAILCFDVLEHIPDFGKALAECHRVLAPGGALLCSVPFLQDREATRIRAHFDAQGTLVHDYPPAYHGDPVQPERGVLCFQEFGWDILDRMRAAGFAHATAIAFHDRNYGYLGGMPLFFVAWKKGDLATAIADLATGANAPVRSWYRRVVPLSLRTALRRAVRAPNLRA